MDQRKDDISGLGVGSYFSTHQKTLRIQYRVQNIGYHLYRQNDGCVKETHARGPKSSTGISHRVVLHFVRCCFWSCCVRSYLSLVMWFLSRLLLCLGLHCLWSSGRYLAVSLALCRGLSRLVSSWIVSFRLVRLFLCWFDCCFVSFSLLT